VERSETPGTTMNLSRQPAEAGDSDWLYLDDIEMANHKKLPPASRA
jgi:hypothetical protein